ncbi:unnamed protein product [Prunus brigantina]
MGSSTALIRNHASMNDHDHDHDHDLGVDELMGSNRFILMSLLEELQEEDRDDERLNIVIQSLEAELVNIPSTMDSESTVQDVEDGNLWNVVGGLDGQECSVSSSVDFDQMGWFDVDQVACSPSDDMNWYMDSCCCEYVMDCPAAGSEWIDDYYCHVSYGVGLEEHAYSSLWQENVYDSIMYD